MTRRLPHAHRAGDDLRPLTARELVACGLAAALLVLFVAALLGAAP